MTLKDRLLAWLPRFGKSPDDRPRPPLEAHRNEVLVRAHGDWIAFLATILERERLIAGDELARLLAEYASVTAADRPAEGQILATWAAQLEETARILRDEPSLH